MSIYYGMNRKAYTLSSVLGSGGEGSIYNISGNDNLVAKIYSSDKLKSADFCLKMEEKINTMINMTAINRGYSNNHLLFAWPLDILHDSNGRFVGYVMEKVRTKYHIFTASRERERLALFPHYSWKTAVTIAYNLAYTVAEAHKAGIIIGDMNPNNIMLTDKGFITLIDTDSFNITNIRTGKIYKCSVGVGEILAPELQGKNLAKANAQFTRQSDNFSLAIHIFMLLMNNCHPFGCHNLSKNRSSTGEERMEHNIVDGYCPYVQKGNGNISKKAPDMKMLPKEIRDLFERCFSYDTATALNPSTINNRPTAAQWCDALYRLLNSPMKQCSHGKYSHVYPADYTAGCPWCAIENKTATVNKTKVTTKKGNNHRTAGALYYYVKRRPILLYIACILTGMFISPLFTGPAINGLYRWLDICMSYQTGRIILIISGGMAGAAIARLFSNKYIMGKYGWLWILISLAVPVLTVLADGIIALAIVIVCGLLKVLFYILIIAAIVGALCG